MLDSRKISIINLLLEQDDFITINEIAGKLQVSKRTVRYDFDAIDDWLIRNDCPKLLKIPRKGVIIEVSEHEKGRITEKLNQSNYYSYVLSPEERREIVLFHILNEDGPSNLLDLAEKTFVSKTTISNDLEEISSWLDQFNLKLVRRKGYGVYINGLEENNRKAIAALLKQLAKADKQGHNNQSIDTYVDSLKEWFPRIDFDFIKNEIEKAQESLGIKFSYEGFANILSHLALAIERIYLHKDIEMSKEQLHGLMKKEEFIVAKVMGENVSKFLNIKVPLDEIGYITLHLTGAKLSKVNNQDKYLSKNTKLSASIDQMIYSVEKSLQIFIVNRFPLKSDLYIHLMPTLHRLKFNKQLQNPLLDEIKTRYKDIFDACYEASRILEHEFDIMVNEHEVAYIAMHFGAAIETQAYKSKRCTNVLLVCASGIGTSRLLQAKLLSYFKSFNIIDTVSYQDVNGYMGSNEIDLIISTIPLNETKKPVIVVTPLLNKRDIEILSSYLMYRGNYKNIQYDKSTFVADIIDVISKHCKIENYEGLQSDITSLLNKINKLYSSQNPLIFTKSILAKENIQIKVECETWEDAIYKAASPLLKKGYINSRYIDSVFQKIEKYGPYMVIAPGIAMPHAGVDDGVYKTGLSIMTLKHPIKFNHPTNDPVQTVIFLAATDNYTHIETLTNLLDILSVKENIDKIQQAEEAITIFDLLKDKEVTQ
ncbi:BglG family transcription antiterminator [Wukongibacter sp. M2B1]|uniref:BglG family transcription antiterminator n=1 Tax=Wukongibacter sp. M2B1 TaxID=3088895 RepID=UPI003D7A597D